MTSLTLQELALHMGCECEYEYCVDNSTHEWRKYSGTLSAEMLATIEDHRNIRLILRPLSDMTEAEATEFLATFWPTILRNEDRLAVSTKRLVMYRLTYSDRYDPNELLWLARHGFDVLGLLDDGRATRRTGEVRGCYLL